MGDSGDRQRVELLPGHPAIIRINSRVTLWQADGGGVVGRAGRDM